MESEDTIRCEVLADQKGAEMTRGEAERYKDLLAEVAYLEDRCDQRRRATADTVKGSSPEFPYTERTIRVQGVAPENEGVDRRERAILRADYAEIGRIEAAIFTAPLEYRRILIAYYIDGKSQAAIAAEMAMDQKTVSNRIAEYFEREQEVKK